MTRHQEWFEEFRKSKEYLFLEKRPIAYFCAEFALINKSPLYAGGLGVLAADTVLEAADQGIPMVALGMFYEEGYFHYELANGETLLKHPPKSTPPDFGFKLIVDANKQPIIISIPLQGRQLKVRAFEKQIKTVRIFLLDTDIEGNDPMDRDINDRLYVGNKETRFKQQMVLGIAGLRLLEILKIHPSVYHLNEGHSGLLAFEVAHHEMNEYKGKYNDELDRAKRHIVFTNHTLLAAGNDTFNSDMASALLSDYSSELQVPVNDLTSQGVIKDSSIFSMTVLSMRMASRANAVSKLHAKKAEEIWPDHPMISVTNGIHVGTWDKIGEELHSDKGAKMQSYNNSGALNQLSPETAIWNKHQENKRELLRFIKEKTGKDWDENHLLLAWARRIVPYKRPLALFQDKEKLLKLVTDSRRPVRIVLAGSAHESDSEGAGMLEEIRILLNSELGRYITYLPDYNISLGKLMTSGADVWLNTPVVGFEACGTSGMKASLNGVLPCTTKDGWVAEVELYKIGWTLDSDRITESLLEILEHNIIPEYYFKNTTGIPGAWLENMKNARELILNEFTTTRMLKEYFTQMYLPVLSELFETQTKQDSQISPL